VYSYVIRPRHPLFTPPVCSPTPTCMFKIENVTELEKSVEEVLKKFMADKATSEGVQASSTRGLQDSPLTGHHSSCVNPATE
jgi:hypothetical protein